MRDATEPGADSPQDLPRLVMRRAGAVALAVLLLALLLGLLRIDDDIDGEVDAAMTLAAAMGRLGQLGQVDDRSALESLRALQAGHPLRHLALRVHAQDGQLLLGPPPRPMAGLPLRWLLDLHRAWLSAPDSRSVAWPVQRGDGSHWTVSLSASHDSERREAIGNLLDMLGLLLAGVLGLLAVMHWNVRQAFVPLGRLLQAIVGIEGHDARQVQQLPSMPIRELEQVAAALRHLATALDAAEQQRRQLSQQVLTLQEDERARLARDLHDEFGQRLTALRADAAWLARQVQGQPALAAVVDGMARQCALVQADIRSLLSRLQPFGPLSGGQGDAESLARGIALLQALVHSWAAQERGAAVACRLDLHWRDAAGQPQAWPVGADAEALHWPRSLWLTLYRISQEALTNAARHAQAGEVVLSLHCQGGRQPGQPLRVDWGVRDDGVGLGSAAAQMQRGNGLVGLQQRVWAQGSELRLSATWPDHRRPGLSLAASFDTWLVAA